MGNCSAKIKVEVYLENYLAFACVSLTFDLDDKTRQTSGSGFELCTF